MKTRGDHGMSLFCSLILVIGIVALAPGTGSAQTTSLGHWWKSSWRLLVVRGSNGLAKLDQGLLFIKFQSGAGRAEEGLQPGEASWLDRPLAPSEPHELEQLAENASVAQELVGYLASPDHYIIFECAYVKWNGPMKYPRFSLTPGLKQGVFVSAYSEPFIPETSGRATPSSPSAQAGKSYYTIDAPPNFADPEVNGFIKQYIQDAVDYLDALQADDQPKLDALHAGVDGFVKNLNEMPSRLKDDDEKRRFWSFMDKCKSSEQVTYYLAIAGCQPWRSSDP